jgi:ParB/RepB/Spo0J family partition protein
MLTNKYKRVPLNQIEVLRDARQRRELQVDDLLPSIKARGVIQPIIVEELSEGRYRLVAGERRYTASQRLGIADIPARLAGDLSPIERQILELEENAKREDLTWQDHVLAISHIHGLYLGLDSEWTQEKTADAIGMDQSTISITLRVAEELETGNTHVEAATSYRGAYNIITRHDDRRVGDVLNLLLSEPEDKPTTSTPHAVSTPVKIPQNLHPESIINGDFITWAKTYTGKPFSFIHCDFPYGIGIDESEQGNASAWQTYHDADNVFWDLCYALAEHLDKLLTQQGHIMFWLPSDIVRQRETLEYFSHYAPSLEFVPVPLVWHKSDNRGILSDPRRRARHVYETALYASRGGRLVVRSVSDTVSSPTSKEVHQSEKPEPMLRHFFAMFVDEYTRMLDPTCGSGTSLRAAESLRAESVLGIELNSDYCEGAKTYLRKHRNLRVLDGNIRNKYDTA